MSFENEINKWNETAYQKSFRIAFMSAIYVFLVSHCYNWTKKKTVNNQKIKLLIGECGHWSGIKYDK